MSADLKPCPFCGGDAEEFEADPVPLRWLGVVCMKCGASTAKSSHQERPVEWWNRRATPAPTESRQAPVLTAEAIETLARECGVYLYAHRTAPGEKSHSFHPEAWAKFVAALASIHPSAEGSEKT